MTCYQCEQTIKPNGCTKVGVCTKDPLTAALQDLIIFGLAQPNAPTGKACILQMFMTLTNTNHNLDDLKKAVEEIKASIKSQHFTDLVKKVLSTSKSEVSPHFYEKKYGKDLNAIAQLGI
jgi:hydroxylamine reductase